MGKGGLWVGLCQIPTCAGRTKLHFVLGVGRAGTAALAGMQRADCYPGMERGPAYAMASADKPTRRVARDPFANRDDTGLG